MTALIRRQPVALRRYAYLLLVLELTPLMLLYLSLFFVSDRHSALGPLYELFVKRPVGAGLILLSFAVFAFHSYRAIPRYGKERRDIARIVLLIALFLLLSAIASFLQSIIFSSALSIDRQLIIRSLMAFNLFGDAISVIAVLTVWSLYWALGTSPSEEGSTLTSILLAGALVVIWARTGRFTGAGYWESQIITITAATAFALDLLTLVLAAGLVTGKQLRSLTLHWRLYICFVAGAAAISLVQDRLGYELATIQSTVTDPLGLLRLSGLGTFLWTVAAALWALAAVSMDPCALRQGADIARE